MAENIGIDIVLHWEFRGSDNRYHILAKIGNEPEEEIHATFSEYERDMFIAELKARVGLMNALVGQNA